MILQALADYYDTLASQEKVCPPGWSIAKVSFALELSEKGELVSIVPLKVCPEGAKKEIPREMVVPEQVKKSSGIASNFLCENGSYILGYDSKGKPERAEQCFKEARRLHHEVLDPVDDPLGRELLLFFDHWLPADTENNTILKPYLEEISKGANMIFMTSDGVFAQNHKNIREAWEEYSGNRGQDGEKMRCLVTGEYTSFARLHPNIKGIVGAQPSGASLVSFNAPAFESYGHEQGRGTGQGMNAPVSERVAFKYGAALNYMINDREHTQRVGDTTIIYWAETADSVCQDLMGLGAFGAENEYTLEDLKRVVNQIRTGGSVFIKEAEIIPDNTFYVLGLAPNASRLSVRLFQQDSFGNMLNHLMEHHERLQIIRPNFEKNEMLTLWRLLNETANQKAKTKSPPASLVGPVLRAILQGTALPDALYENILIRIRSEHDIKWKKAAIIKAYFLSLAENERVKWFKEVSTVELNEESKYVPYILGRLFAVLEKIQTDASPGINTTIKDRYFTSASTTPAIIIPMLLKLSQHHQRKLEDKNRIFYEKLIQELQGRIHTMYPDRMTLQEQGAFYLGYYHQKQSFYTPKEKKED